METITIHNFGPIKHLEVEIKDINIFIGSTATGKSTVAKLLAIFSGLRFSQFPDINNFEKLLTHYNINFEITYETYISYRRDIIFWKLNGTEISTNLYQFRRIFGLLTYVYENFQSQDKYYRYSLNIAPPNFTSHAILSYIFVNSLDPDSAIEEINLIQNEHIRNKILPTLYKLKQAKDDIHKAPGSARIENINSIITELIDVLIKVFSVLNVVYIPAERVALSMLSESIFSILNNDISLPNCFKDFGAKFEVARNEQKNIHIGILDATYQYTNGQNRIIIRNGSSVKLEQASSGFQSLVPMYAVVEYYTRNQEIVPNLFIFEEPELNLYPTIQKRLVEFIAKSFNTAKFKIIITTHSPYILTSIDNLIQANNTFEKKNDLKQEINSLIPEEIWLIFEKVSSYYFHEGTANSTLEIENKSLGSSSIDDVSEEIGETFEKLLDLKYT